MLFAAVAVARFADMRRHSASFMIQFPGKKYRHEKPDLKTLLEKREEKYVDLFQASCLTHCIIMYLESDDGKW